MATARQRAAARRNVKKAATTATRKRTIAHLPKRTRRHWVNKEPRAPAGNVVLPDERAKAPLAAALKTQRAVRTFFSQ